MRRFITLLAATVGTAALFVPGGGTPVEAGAPTPAPKVFRIASVGDIACDPDSSYNKVAGYCQHARVGALVKRMVSRGTDLLVTLGDAHY